jgi:transcriptional regulator with XRE-family HTH domain
MEVPMVSAAQALEVRSKIIGVLIRAARLRTGKTVKDCAEWLGCSPSTLSQYEYGRSAPSLPELELLALLFDLPVNHLWDADSANLEDPLPRPPAERIQQLRHKEIGILLRQARSEAGMTQAECAKLVGVSSGMIGRYERGDTPIPFVHLEILAPALGIPWRDLFDSEFATSRIAVMPAEDQLLSAEDSWARLPPRIQDFVRKPDSLPFLEMAFQVYGLPKDSLRQLAEAMLSTGE